MEKKLDLILNKIGTLEGKIDELSKETSKISLIESKIGSLENGDE